MITVVVMTDGRRDYITRSMATLHHLKAPVSARIIHDDSGDEKFNRWLWEVYGNDGWIVHATPARSGFAGAVRSARRWVADNTRNEWVVWMEDDFLLTRDIPVRDMVGVMAERPNLVQLALRRQPWNETEKAAGGIVEMNPDYFTDVTDGVHSWLEHRWVFTTNPHLFRRSLITEGPPWPTGPESEGRYGIELFGGSEQLRAAYWGSRSSGEWCEHIGVNRIGTGY